MQELWKRIRQRSALELKAVVWEVIMLAVSTIYFHSTPSMSVLNQFNHDLGWKLTNDHIAFGCLVGMALSIMTLYVEKLSHKRWLYRTAISALAFYTIPAANFSYVTTGRLTIGAFALGFLWFPCLLIADATFREVKDAVAANTAGEPAADVPAATADLT